MSSPSVNTVGQSFTPAGLIPASLPPIPAKAPSSSKMDTNSEDTQTPRKSVKYLTCYYWYNKGSCRKSEEECLYSHHDTGLYANKPTLLRPGGPVVAGRSADTVRNRYRPGYRKNRAHPKGRRENQTRSSLNSDYCVYPLPLMSSPESTPSSPSNISTTSLLDLDFDSDIGFPASTVTDSKSHLESVAQQPPAGQFLPLGSAQPGFAKLRRNYVKMEEGKHQVDSSPKDGSISKNSDASRSKESSSSKATRELEQTVAVAQELDCALCIAMDGFVKVNNVLDKFPNNEKDQAEQIGLLQSIAADYFAFASNNRATAQSFAKGNDAFGKIFAHTHHDFSRYE